MKKNILFVDDEKQILRAVNRLFMDSKYTVFMADNGEDALNILGKENIDMLISDMRMPGMDGYQLLKAVKEKFPSVIRIILSGYAEGEVVFKSFRQNLAKLYMFKPWDNSLLMSSVNRVFETEKVLKDKNLLSIVSNLEELPTISDTYNRFCSLIDIDADVRDFSALIEEDPSIAAKVLHYANSAFFGAKTGSISQAIMYMGLDNIKNIVLTATVFDRMNSREKLLHLREELWEHACLCNKAVILLHEKLLGKRLPDIYASAGLLHDIGKIVFISNFPDGYSRLIKTINTDRSKSFVDIETEAFSVSHQEMGGYLLDWWELPLPIVEAALYHHSPGLEQIVNKELVSIVHIADYFVWELMGSNSMNSLDIDVMDNLNISMAECRKIVRNIYKGL